MINKIMNNKNILILLLLPFFKPVCFQYISKLIIVDQMFILFKIISSIIIIVLLQIHIFKFKSISKSILFIFIFELSIFISTIINKGDIERAIIDLVTIVSFCIYIYLMLKYNLKYFFEISNKILVSLMIINFIIMLIYPNGVKADLYTNLENPLFFMIIDNGVSLFILTTIFINSAYRSINNKKINKYVLIISFLTAIISKSSTGIIVCTLHILYIVLIYNKNIKKFLNPYIIFLIYIVIQWIVLSGRSSIFYIIITGIFKKDLSFTGRVSLWNRALEMITIKPIIGYGRSKIDYISIWGGRFSSHNFLLELLLQGGIISLILFIFIILKVIKKQKAFKNTKLANLLMVTLFFMFISVLMEITIHSTYLFIIIMLNLELHLITKKCSYESLKGVN